MEWCTTAYAGHIQAIKSNNRHDSRNKDKAEKKLIVPFLGDSGNGYSIYSYRIAKNPTINKHSINIK